MAKSNVILERTNNILDKDYKQAFHIIEVSSRINRK